MSIVPLYRVTPIQCGDCLTNEQMRSDGTQVHLPEGWAALELTGPSRYLTLMFLCQRCGDKTTAMPEPPPFAPDRWLIGNAEGNQKVLAPDLAACDREYQQGAP